MKEGPASWVQLLRPVLDTYMDGAVALVGCQSYGLARDSCEHDVLVIGQEHLPPASIRVGEGFVDLFFLTEREATRPAGAEIFFSLAFAKPVRDNALVLSSCVSAARDSMGENSRRSGDERLTSAVKAVGRSEESLSKGRLRDADFWLMSAGYEFAQAWLFSEGKMPAPSHILGQLRELSRRRTGMFEAFSKASGLQSASRSACEARLDSLGVLYDLMEAPGTETGAASPASVKVSYELLRRKSESMIKAAQPVDCYCFLGLEAARCLPEVLLSHVGGKTKTEIVSSLSEGESRLIADTVVQALGITRTDDEVRDGLQALRGQVSDLTRRA